MSDNDKAQLDRELTTIVKHLSGWRLDPRFNDHCWCAVIIDDQGHGIHFNIQHAKGRYYISGNWPWDNDHNQYSPAKSQHITIGRNRTAEQVVAELNGRFLPWYLTAYAEQVERMAKHKARRTQQQEITVELAALLGPNATRRLQSNPNQIYVSGLTVEVENGGESVSIQLRYQSAKIAKAVLRAYVKAGGLQE
jgi:hypothetical protein